MPLIRETLTQQGIAKPRHLHLLQVIVLCYSEGSTENEALEMIKDAIKLHIEDWIANNEILYEEVFSNKVEVIV